MTFTKNLKKHLQFKTIYGIILKYAVGFDCTPSQVLSTTLSQYTIFIVFRIYKGGI